MNITLYINKLLNLHDCVILPGFGGFVTNYINAKVSEKNIFSPPRKIVAFNRNLKNDDGLLINYIINKEGINYSEAKNYLFEFVNDINYKLGLSKEIIFDEIGSFKIDNNKILQFEPVKTSNFLTDSYGLSTFYFPKIKRENNIKKATRIFKDKESVKPVIKKLPVKRILVGSFILFILALIPYNTSVIKDLKVNLSSLLPTGKIIENQKIIKTTPKTKVLVNINTKINKDAETVKVTNKSEKTIETISDEKNYQIIAGCFKNLKNAENFVITLSEKGITASILNNSSGLYKVSVGSFDSKTDAISQINIIHNSNSDISVWLSTK